MPSLTPSPPYLPHHHHPAAFKHYQGGGSNGGGGGRQLHNHHHHHQQQQQQQQQQHQHHPPAGVHSSSFHRVNSSSSATVAATANPVHTPHQSGPPSTPHSTLQSSSSNQSSSHNGQGGQSRSVPPLNGGLNMSSVSSKQSVGGNSGSVSPGTTGTGTRTTGLDQSRDNSHLTDLSHISRITPLPPKPHHMHTNNDSTINNSTTGPYHQSRISNGHIKTLDGNSDLSRSFVPRLLQTARKSSSSRGLLYSLCLLCLISVMMAMLSLIFLLDLTPITQESGLVAEVSVSLSCVSLLLDLSCAVVCAGQFIMAIKLHSAHPHDKAAHYLQQSSGARLCAVSGFFLSIPLLLTGVVLHSVLGLQTITALATSVFIGLGALVCCAVMIHSVLLWRKHKRRPVPVNPSAPTGMAWNLHSTSSPLPPATVDLSASVNIPQQELSTLV